MPNSEEVKSLHQLARKAASNENTFNLWAGYQLVPSDYQKLKSKINALQYSLLKPVGSFKASKVGEANIYDLGGNVAELYQNGIYGYSAYDYFDANNDDEITSQHTGIRVIKE